MSWSRLQLRFVSTLKHWLLFMAHYLLIQSVMIRPCTLAALACYFDFVDVIRSGAPMGSRSRNAVLGTLQLPGVLPLLFCCYSKVLLRSFEDGRIAFHALPFTYRIVSAAVVADTFIFVDIGRVAEPLLRLTSISQSLSGTSIQVILYHVQRSSSTELLHSEPRHWTA